MDEYFIGGGAILTAGPAATIAGAMLHAQPQAGIGVQMEAVVVDFEATKPAELSRLLIAAAGWSGPRFCDAVVGRLLARRQCDLADVFTTLAEGVGAAEIDLFAHWSPDAATLVKLGGRGITVRRHPVEAIGPAAVVSGQRLARWHTGRAA